MIEACTCDDGLGLNHSHCLVTVQRGDVLSMKPTSDVWLWVDWKAVARALMKLKEEVECACLWY